MVHHRSNQSSVTSKVTKQQVTPPHLQFRNLKENLAGVIFMCSNKTEEECFQKGLFGSCLPHMQYIRYLKAGSHCFLYNIDQRMLHGVFKATSKGGVYESFAWGSTRPEGSTDFPAQIKVQRVSSPPSLPFKQFQHAIRDNIIRSHCFLCELDSKQLSSLLELFHNAYPPSPTSLTPAGPSATRPSNRFRQRTVNENNETAATRPSTAPAPSSPPLQAGPSSPARGQMTSVVENSTNGNNDSTYGNKDSNGVNGTDSMAARLRRIGANGAVDEQVPSNGGYSTTQANGGTDGKSKKPYNVVVGGKSNQESAGDPDAPNLQYQVDTIGQQCKQALSIIVTLNEQIDKESKERKQVQRIADQQAQSMQQKISSLTKQVQQLQLQVETLQKQ